jgi:hypothetical protein
VALQYPRRYSTAGTVYGLRGRGPAARAVRGAGNADWASPTADKREGFSF